jgi:signal transduction histidine kinase
MSDRAQTALGEPEHLIDLVVAIAIGSPVVVGHPSLAALRLWRVWQTSNSVLVGALPAEPSLDIIIELWGIQGDLLAHFFRLWQAEQSLALKVLRRRRRSGRTAIRQIELERQRLGRELHTGVGQMLAAMQLQLDIVKAHLPEAPPEVSEALERLRILADQTMGQIRGISRRLHPPEWQGLTLEAAIRQLWELSGVPQRFEAWLRLDPLPREPELEIKVLLYRAVQEGLSNLVRHAGATQVSVSLTCAADQITLEIVDNGVGFDAASHAGAPAGAGVGLGIRSIRDQAEAVGGKVLVESRPGSTKLVVTVGFSPVES